MSVDVASVAAVADELRSVLTRLATEAARADDVDLSPTQRFSLAVLVDEGPLRLGALACRVGVSAATASRAVEALVVAGLADRVPDPSDRRAVLIDASARGRRLVEGRRARVTAEVERGLRDFTPQEREALYELLRRFGTALADR